MFDERKSLLNDDDMPKSITLNKLNGLNYLVWTHAMNNFLSVKKNLKYLINDPSQCRLMIGWVKILLLWDDFGIVRVRLRTTYLAEIENFLLKVL